MTPAQVFALIKDFPLLQKTMTLLAAGTGLRISEILGLKWEHVDFERQRILVKQTWIDEFGVGKPKTQASGKPVPLAPLLAEVMREWKKETTYGADSDWVFASQQKKGKQPVTGGIMAQRYLRPAAEKLGIIEPGDPRRFGWHSLRHSLASFLIVTAKVDPKTTQSILRHSNSSTTMDLYVHANVGCQDGRATADDGGSDEGSLCNRQLAITGGLRVELDRNLLEKNDGSLSDSKDLIW